MSDPQTRALEKIAEQLNEIDVSLSWIVIIMFLLFVQGCFK